MLLDEPCAQSAGLGKLDLVIPESRSPTPSEIPGPHGGVRPGAGRPAQESRRVKRSVTLSPAMDAWVRAHQHPPESYRLTLERLLQAVQPWHLVADTLPDAVVLLVSRLRPERQRVPVLSRRLGWSRGHLQRVVQEHRDDLARLEVRLHVATKDVAFGRKEGYLTIDGVRYRAMSLDAPLP